MADVGSLRVLISAVDKTSSGLASAQKSISTFVQQNKVLMMGMGTAILGAFAMAAKASADFDQALSRVTMTMNDAGVSANLFKTQINEMVKTIPKSADELGAAAYQIVQGGIKDTAQALQVLEAASKLSTVAMTDTAETAAFLTSVMDMYNISGAEAGKTANTLFKAINAGETSLSEFAAGFAKIGPMAANMGVSLEEVAGVYATLTASEIPAFEASMALKGMLADLASISPKTAAAAKAMGVEFSYAALQSKGLSQFLMDIGTATQGDEQKLAKLFPSIKQFNSLLALTKPASETFKNTMDTLGNGVNSMDDAFKTASESMGNQFTLLKNEFGVFAREVGDVVIPIIREILPIISSIVRAFAEMPPVVRTVGVVLGLIAGAGLILIPITATLITSTTALATALGLVAVTAPAAAAGIGAVAAISTTATVGTATFATALGGVGVAGTVAGAGILATVAPIALVVAGVGALGLLVYKVGMDFGWWTEQNKTFEKSLESMNLDLETTNALLKAHEEASKAGTSKTVSGLSIAYTTTGRTSTVSTTTGLREEIEAEIALNNAMQPQLSTLTELQQEMSNYQEQILQSASDFEYIDMIRYAGMDKIQRAKAQELALLQTQDTKEREILQLQFDKMNAMFDILALENAEIKNKGELVEWQGEINKLKGDELATTMRIVDAQSRLTGGVSSGSLLESMYEAQTQWRIRNNADLTTGEMHDFISRPGQPIQAISSQDTVIGVKNPANTLNMFDSPAQGSSSKYVIENRIYLDGRQIAVAVGEHTAEDMSRRGR
jgi:TP901 family phage tail tape measure protein